MITPKEPERFEDDANDAGSSAPPARSDGSPGKLLPRRGRSWSRRLAIAGLLILVLLILGGGLIWVWVRSTLDLKLASPERHDPGPWHSL